MPEHGIYSARLAAALVLAALALVATTACSSARWTGAQKGGPAPRDAIRAAEAAQDPILQLAPKGVATGQIVSTPYMACDGDSGCAPVGSATRSLDPAGTSHDKLALFYIANLASSFWIPESIHCDPTLDQYVIVAAKDQSSAYKYVGRLEIFADNQPRLHITVPADGHDADFALAKNDPAYPQGTCPPAIEQAFAAATRAPVSTPVGGATTTTAALATPTTTAKAATTKK